MRPYNVQWREEGELMVRPVVATSLDNAKLQIMAKEDLRDSQVLEDEAIL